MLRRIEFCVCLLLWTTLARATPEMGSYPSAGANHNVCSEIKDDRDRKIYSNDWFCGAADGSVFLRALGPEEFYHGFSYWVQARTQFDPNDFFRINVRSIFYSGSVSYGYALPTNFYSVIGFSGKWPSPILGGDLRARVMDLERQTIGAGVWIEEFETAGMRVDWSWDNWNIKLMGEGTGGLVLRDDTVNFEIAYGPNASWLGLGGIWWTEGGDGIKRKPTAYVYSIVDWSEYFRTKFEIDSRNSKYASLASIGTQFQTESWNFASTIQGRVYDPNVADGFSGLVQHLYTSYDQLDKSFTNAKNILLSGDDVAIYSINLNVTYEIDDRWRVFALNEAGRFEYRQLPATRFWYAKAAVVYTPLEKRRDNLTFFYSNKVLNDSLALPPNIISTNSVMNFKQVDYYGIEANFKF